MKNKDKVPVEQRAGLHDHKRRTGSERFWNKVADELCDCGHEKSLHSGPTHHAECSVRRCNCPQFTWKAFIGADGKEIA